METINLSDAQTEIIQLQEYYENNSINNISVIIYIKPGIKIEEIEKALNNLIKTHETYRIKLKKVKSEYKQYISEHKDKKFDFVDFKNNQVGYTKWINEQARKNLFSTDSDLFDFKIVKLPTGKIGIFLMEHHVISDAWSITVAANTISKYLNDGPNSKEIESTYFDYIEEEIEYKNTKRFEKDKSFWLKKTENLEDNELFEKNSDNNGHSNRKSYSLSDIETHRIHEFCEKNNISINNLFSAMMIIIKYKKTASKKISVGSIMHNRNKKAEKGVTGVFSRALPIIIDVSSDYSISDLLTQTKYETFNILKHRKYPYRNIVEDSGGQKGLLDCLISYQNTQYSHEVLKNVYSDEWIENGSNNAPLTVNISNRNRKNTLTVDYDYQTAIVNEKEIIDLHNIILKIMDKAIENPNTKIKNIEILDENEKYTILNEFNDTEASLNNKETFVERFEKQVKATPYQTAITYEGESLNYDELNARANQLAYQLRAEGVGANSLIALIMDRQLETIIGIYGILKAGGAYVPIDPKYPIDRINYILEDSQPKVLLTDRELDEAINYGNKVIDLTETTRLEAFPTSNLKQISDESNLMYVIYTSGTTGKPKGVMAHSEGVMNRLNWVINKYNVDGEDTILFKTPYTFDVSVWEIFGWAMLGSQIVLLPSGEEGNPEKITELLEGYSVAMVHFVPSMLNMFVNFIKSTNNAQAISKLKYVLASGEALKPEQVNDFNHFIGNKNNTALLNLYGPTETTVDVTSFDCENHKTYDSIPIGKPISNIQAYILNEDNNIMGIGVPGELCIAGVGVTAGYLNRPELTQEKFIDNPFGKGKLYRTGDLAKWNGDGNIIYIGRIDEQVKIRGYRIELGEIESILRQHTHINDVAIVARPMVDNELSICAYLVSDDSLDFGSLKTSLGQKLPDYMIPAYMTQLDELPVTSNGKLNKKALPEIKVESKVYVAPTNDMESAVAKTFEAVLHVDQISIHDNFFEMGGDSLKAIKLTSLISKSYNISIKDIFELQTIASISKALVEREEMNVMTKLDALKIPNVKNEHHFNSDFISEINDYKVKSNENYKFIDKDVVKSDKQILLTGATGYLGIHILKDLLERKDLIIYVLVRNSEKISGENKLNNNWFYYFNSQLKTEDLSRIHFVEGDIESKYLGFSNSNYDYLVNNIDIIINAAANVNHFATEESSYNTNVKSIHNLISFAKDKNKKEIHHMSTISIASGSIEDKDSSTFSEYDVDISQKPNNIYIDSKIEAEKLLIAYREEGIETNIYRLGNLQCDSRTGIFQKNEENNAFYSVIKSFKMLQKFPRLEEDDLEFTHVDQAAKACNKLILNDQLSNEIHHIYNNKRLSLQKLMAVYNENNHYIEAVYWDAFLDHLMECINLGVMSDEVNAFLLHTGILDNTLFNKAHFEILDYKTNFILEKLNFQWEPTSENTLNIMINHTKNNF
ncbi:non-ribosomal peptide synthetase [Staphylococcus equorum]|uniref:non-ribosomal peptide synthetase n=1 Tax=Staphylococcus equorum TaxID=246432 RepID=UPI000623BF88|nr:non-ribosomal peptide synthetase [Staphylococcus equorum]KKI53747.1 Peptide synthetase [Staphylococcus equorum subsp. equorum]MCE5008183.1 non-ribosomal peptide synthetase [Staphylococcus equorum]